MSKTKAKKPDYIVKAMISQNGKDMKGKVGAAWINPDRSISVDLNPFVKLEANCDLHITLFPEDMPS